VAMAAKKFQAEDADHKMYRSITCKENLRKTLPGLQSIISM
jgi:hypothetical protein